MLEIEPARIAQLGTNYPTIARVSGSLAGQGGRATGDPAAPATRQRFVESDHSLEAFVLVIVGLAPFPRGLHVSLLDAARLTVLAHPSE